MCELVQRRGALPTAVVAGCDKVAFGALMALKERGLSCPEDFSMRGAHAPVHGQGPPNGPRSAAAELSVLKRRHGFEGSDEPALWCDRIARKTNPHGT